MCLLIKKVPKKADKTFCWINLLSIVSYEMAYNKRSTEIEKNVFDLFIKENFFFVFSIRVSYQTWIYVVNNPFMTFPHKEGAYMWIHTLICQETRQASCIFAYSNRCQMYQIIVNTTGVEHTKIILKFIREGTLYAHINKIMHAYNNLWQKKISYF